MSEPTDAREGQLDQAEFKKKMLSQLQSTGVVGQVKSQLRAQLLSQLQKGQIVQLGPPPGDRPGLKRHALNSMIADYFAAVQYNYSLSVFKEESGVESRPLLTEDELFDVLKVDRETSFYQSYMKSKAHGGSDSCFILNLLNAISEAAAAKGKESFTQTIGGDRYQMEVRMQQLENEYQARLREARMAPGAGLEERLAVYRQEIEEQAAAEVARQVERVREMEVAAARLDEASKARRAMEAERLELDRMHNERLTKLRQREEEMMDKLRRQQRDVENVAYEYRQRILREEERLRNQRTELQQQQDNRQEQLRQLERSLELRERAVAAREAAAEKKLAEATEAAAEAQVEARQDVEREYVELKNNLAQQRMQIEMDRSRLLELRSEATAEIAAARAKEERLRALETARAEAEARAAAHAADAEVCRLQAEKLALELSQVREELSRRLAQASDGADAMLQNAAGAMNMLNAEAVASRAAGSQIRDAMAQLERAREEAADATAQVAELQKERAALAAALAATSSEADALRTQLGRVEALMDEAVAARSSALANVEEGQFRMFQQEREISELRSTLTRTKEEVAALRLQLVVRRPPTRGAESPSRRSITFSPPRRPPPGTAAATISALSLGIALGGGPRGSLAAGGGGGGGYSQQQQQPAGWGYQQSGGGSLAGGTPALSNAEFPIAAAPRDATIERLERLRRQEDIVASQEEGYRKRMSMLQEVRNRSVAMLAGGGGGGASPSRYSSGQTLQGPYQMASMGAQHEAELGGQDPGVPPYMTYVMHSSSPTQHTVTHDPHQQPHLHQQDRAFAQPFADPQAQAQVMEQQQFAYAYQQQQQQYLQQQGHRQLRQGHRHGQQVPQEDAEDPQGQEQQPQPMLMQDQFPSDGQQPDPPRYGQSGRYSYGDPSGQRGGATAPYEGGRYGSGSAGAGPGSGQGLGGGDSGGGGGAPPPRKGTSGFSRADAERSWASGKSQTQSQPPQPQHSTTTGVMPPQEQRQPYGAPGGAVQASSFLGQQGSAPPQGQQDDLPEQPPSAPEQRPYFLTSDSVFRRGTGPGDAPAGEPSAAPPAAPPAPPVVLPPPGLVLTSNLRSAAPADGQGDAESPVPPPAAPEPPKPITIPGLVMVSGFTPRGSTAGMSAPATAPPPPPPPLLQREPTMERVHVPPPPDEMEDMMAAKMRMLQEQRERALAAQQQQQQQQSTGPIPMQRLASRRSISSRASGSPGASATTGSPGTGGGHLPRAEDSTSELIAAGEADDTVAPELSTIHRRGAGTGGRRTSFEGHASRQSSMNRRELGRGTSFVRSEASNVSVEAPNLGGTSARALSMAHTLDDIPSSLEGYELPGLNDDDDGLEAGGDDDRYGGFAEEMSAGSVF